MQLKMFRSLYTLECAAVRTALVCVEIPHSALMPLLMPLSNCVFVICVEIVKGMLCTRLGNKWKTRIGMFATFGSRFFPWLFHADESSVPTFRCQGAIAVCMRKI